MNGKAEDPFLLLHMNKKGVTLLPLILMIIIMGGLVVAGLGLVGSLTTKAKFNDTRNTIDAAIKAIVSWSVANNRIPDVSTGSTGFASVIGNPNDAWGKPLAYIAADNLLNPSPSGVCNRTTTNLRVSSVSDSIAFVVLSGGDDYAVNSAPSASQTLNGTVTVSQNDIVKWVTLDELKNKTGCYGPTQGGFKILNNELPAACIAQAYKATLYSDGGVLPYGDWTWAAPALPAGLSMNFITGAISGAPSTAGVYPVTFTRTDSGGNSVRKTLNLTVKPCPSWLGAFDNSAVPGGTLSGGALIGGTGTGAAGTASALALIGVNPAFIPTDQGGTGYPKFSFDQGQAFSIMAWVKLTRFPTNPTASNIYPFVSKPGNNPTMKGYYLELHSSAFNPPNTSGGHRVAFRLIGTAAGVGKTVTVYNTANIDTLNVWYHIAASYNGSGTASGVRIYVNGASGKTEHQDNLGPLSITNANPLTVGYYSAPPSWGSNFNSIYIDEVHVYNTEVQRLGAAVTGGGVVTSPALAGTSEKLNCGTFCEAFYPKNASIPLTASPSPGSTFTGWSGGCSGTSTSCTVTLSADTTVTATFNP